MLTPHENRKPNVTLLRQARNRHFDEALFHLCKRSVPRSTLGGILLHHYDDLAEQSMADFWLKVDKTIRHHAARTLRSLRGLGWRVRRPLAPKPVFVVGCSRAGTTLVYKTLSEAEELGTIQRETHDFWASLHPLEERGWKSHALSAADASQQDRETASRYFYVHSGSTRFVDKNNQNGLCVPYLHALFPDAHFVYVKRNPGDNIHSLIHGWGKPEEFATWSTHLPLQVKIDKGRYTRWCFFLPKGWEDYTHAPIENVCTLQYRTMNEAIIAAREGIPRIQWTEVKYESLVQDPVAGFRNLFENVGLRFTPQIESHCSSVLGYPYNAFSEIKVDKWKSGAYRDRIDRMLPSLASVVSAMGYTLSLQAQDLDQQVISSCDISADTRFTKNRT